jgi:hypothetical protein
MIKDLKVPFGIFHNEYMCILLGLLSGDTYYMKIMEPHSKIFPVPLPCSKKKKKNHNFLLPLFEK